MDEAPLTGPDAGLVRYLKWLVTTLTVTMIVGLVVLIAVVVMRLNETPGQSFPDQIALPDGATATAITRGSDWIAVVTDDDRILIYDTTGQTLRQEIAVD